MEAIWQKTRDKKETKPLKKDLKTDVLVIGAGMAGILTAYFLHKQGIDVVVAEADQIGSGQTKHTTAKITYQHGVLYDRLISVFGETAARQYATLNRDAIDDFEQIILDEAIDCDFQRLPSYLYARKQSDTLSREAKAMRRIGIAAKVTTETGLPFQVKEALKVENQAQFHPLKFLQRISEQLCIYEGTNILRIEDHTAYTETASITAKHIVITTHYPFTNRPGYFFMRMHQQRSYVLALKDAAQLEGMYYGIEQDAPWSFRNYKGLLLMGGGAHRTGQIPSRAPYQVLKETALSLWPQCKEAGFWSAQDCMTIDGIPYIGQFSRKRAQWHIGTGFQKWGMSNGMVAARLLTEQITGKSKSRDTIFHPGRFQASVSFFPLLKEGVYTAKQFTKGLAGKNPRCTHLGCGLEWNLHEKVWECPCHGSRFGESGNRIDNPAQQNLTGREGLK